MKRNDLREFGKGHRKGEAGAGLPDLRRPKGLTRRAGELWDKLVPVQVNTPERAALLRVALEALGRYDSAREIIRREGMTTCSKRGRMSHAHPLLAVERAARREFTRIWFRLRLHAEWVDWQDWPKGRL